MTVDFLYTEPIIFIEQAFKLLILFGII